MLAYIVIAVLTVALAFFAKDRKGVHQKISIVIAALPSSILAAFRFNIGPDWSLYQRIFDSVRLTGGFYSVKSLEPGYLLLNKLVAVIGANYQVLLFIIAMSITCLFFFAFLKLSDSFVSCVALYFILGFYFDSLNGLRQYIAAAIVFYGLSYVQDGKPVRWIISCLLAALFHATAIPVVMIYPVVRHLKLSTIKTIIAVGALIFFGKTLYGLVKDVLVYTRYAYYLNSLEFEVEPTRGTTIISATITIIAVFFGVYSRGIEESECSKFRHRTMTCMSLFALLSALLSFFVPLALRVQYYFMPFEMVFIPYAVALAENKNLRILVTMCLFIMFSCMTSIGIVLNGWYGVYPYRAV